MKLSKEKNKITEDGYKEVKMEKKKNKWLETMAQVRKDNPTIKSFKEIAKIAKKEYSK
jgi:hypothetical protein